MQIDPLEAVVRWLATNLTSAGGRVAAKHRYGEAWSETQMGVSVHLDGGLPDLYASVATPRFEIRIYSDDQAKIVNVWMELVALTRVNSRFAVFTSRGRALVHYVLPDTNLSMLYDDVLKMDLGVVFVKSSISEEVISYQ